MMDYYDKMLAKRTKDLKGCCWLLLAVVIAVILTGLFCSCSSVKYIPVETVRTEYKTVKDSFIQKDSIFVKDSVLIESKGDTVWYQKWHTKYIDRWHEVVRIDSFVKRDSIQVPYPVEKKLTKWQQVKIDYGGEAIILAIVVIFIVIWLIFKRIMLQR